LNRKHPPTKFISSALQFITLTLLIFACPLFHNFCESIKTAKLQGMNIELQILEISTSLKNRPDDQTNSLEGQKETSWLSRSGLNTTRTIPPRYNNITLGNHLYARHKGLNVTNPN